MDEAQLRRSCFFVAHTQVNIEMERPLLFSLYVHNLCPQQRVSQQQPAHEHNFEQDQCLDCCISRFNYFFIVLHKPEQLPADGARSES